MNKASKKTLKKGLLILGNPGSGKLTLINAIKTNYHKDEVFVCKANTKELKDGILPWGLIAGNRIEKLIVFEFITDISEAIQLYNAITSLSLSSTQDYPFIVFTSDCLKKELFPFYILGEKFDVIELNRG